MKLDDISIQNLAKIITGDADENLLYRSAPKLIDLFSEYGERTIYDKNFPTRWKFVEKNLHHINGTKSLELLIRQIIDERIFLNEDFDNSKTIELINKTIKYNKYKIIEKEGLYLIQGDLIEEDTPSVKVTFEEIQTKLILELEEAKYIIMIAVAWFSNRKIYEVLKRKKESGVTIKLIISDDDTNKNSGLDYDIFETYKMPKYGKFKYNIIHNKFCIIDLKIVLEGSYNWTNSANNHKEQFVVINSYDTAESFANRFIELRDQIINKTYDFNF